MSGFVEGFGALVLAFLVATACGAAVTFGFLASALGFLPEFVLLFLRPEYALGYWIAGFGITLAVIYR